MSKKPYKVRAKKYNSKLATEGSFRDEVQISDTSNPSSKPIEKKGKTKK
jgi:hypothetical protein